MLTRSDHCRLAFLQYQSRGHTCESESRSHSGSAARTSARSRSTSSRPAEARESQSCCRARRSGYHAQLIAASVFSSRLARCLRGRDAGPFLAQTFANVLPILNLLGSRHIPHRLRSTSQMLLADCTIRFRRLYASLRCRFADVGTSVPRVRIHSIS